MYWPAKKCTVAWETQSDLRSIQCRSSNHSLFLLSRTTRTQFIGSRIAPINITWWH